MLRTLRWSTVDLYCQNISLLSNNNSASYIIAFIRHFIVHRSFLHTFVHVYIITSYTVIIQVAYNSICESNLLTDDTIKYREESSNCYMLSSPNKLSLYLLYPQYLRLYNLRWLYGLIQLELELCLPCKPKHLAKSSIQILGNGWIKLAFYQSNVLRKTIEIKCENLYQLWIPGNSFCIGPG